MYVGGPNTIYGGRYRPGINPKAYTGTQYGNGSFKNFLKSGSRKITRSKLWRKTVKNKELRDLAWTMYKREIAPIVKKKVEGAIGKELTEALEKDGKLIAKKGVKKYIKEDAMPEIEDVIKHVRQSAEEAVEKGTKGAIEPWKEEAAKKGTADMKKSMRGNGFAPTKRRTTRK